MRSRVASGTGLAIVDPSDHERGHTCSRAGDDPLTDHHLWNRDPGAGGPPVPPALAALGVARRSAPAALAPLARHRHLCGATILLGIAAVIALDAAGYSYSAHQLSIGAAGSLVLAAVVWAGYRVVLQIIDEHAWKWVKARHVFTARDDEDDDPAMPDDLAARLRRLTAYLAFGVWLLGAAKCWDVDLAFLRTLGEIQLWPMTAGKLPEGTEVISLGDVTKSTILFALTVAAWRHLATFFAVFVFPRMPDDPGVRFAALTLSRYFVLGLGLLAGLSAIHLGLDKIGVVLAALGVGLGFGLQEVVSNFVCGVILLLERPIRVGDIVTVSGMNGKVDRIHIRATTIVNGDNQSIIVPNRAFITGDLVNWTLRDKVVRLTIKMTVAYGNDPDRVAELLLAVARDDADVLRNPVPSALVEEMTADGLAFVLHAHVPDPSLSGTSSIAWYAKFSAVSRLSMLKCRCRLRNCWSIRPICRRFGSTRIPRHRRRPCWPWSRRWRGRCPRRSPRPIAASTNKHALWLLGGGVLVAVERSRVPRTIDP